MESLIKIAEQDSVVNMNSIQGRSVDLTRTEALNEWKMSQVLDSIPLQHIIKLQHKQIWCLVTGENFKLLR